MGRYVGVFIAFLGSRLGVKYGMRFSMDALASRLKKPWKNILGIITVYGSLGIVIPPSIPMILYCLVMNVSVAELFLAGVLPGLVIGISLMMYAYLKARRSGWKSRERTFLAALAKSAKEGIWALLLPVIVLGGIYSGVFTPTEAAAVSVVYALAVEMIIYKELGFKDIPAVCEQAAILSACLNIQLGMLTPPFGLNLFVAMGITKASLLEIARGVFPFLVIFLVCLFLVTYLPSISLFLPNLLFK
jgi:C4-dicarboxylate transporter DctM subunit